MVLAYLQSVIQRHNIMIVQIKHAKIALHRVLHAKTRTQIAQVACKVFH